MVNQVNLIGNLTKDPVLREIGEDKRVCNFSIAINEYQDKTTFLDIAVFGKQAESCNTYLQKGKKVYICGRIENSQYEKEGRTVYRTSIIAEKVKFLSPKSEEGESHKYLTSDAPPANIF